MKKATAMRWAWIVALAIPAFILPLDYVVGFVYSAKYTLYGMPSESYVRPSGWSHPAFWFCVAFGAVFVGAWRQTIPRGKHRPLVWLWWIVWTGAILRLIADVLGIEGVPSLVRDQWGMIQSVDFGGSPARDQAEYATACVGWAVVGLLAGRLFFRLPGVADPEVTVERGAKIAEAADAARKLRGDAPRRPLLRRIADALVERAPLVAAGGPTRGVIALGGVPIPEDAETKHLQMTGTTGSGKTQAIQYVADAIRERGGRAVVADSGGELWSKYGDPARDVLLNPLDARSALWSPFPEVRESYDPERIAAALVPDSGGDGAWPAMAQNLLAEMMRELDKRGDRSVRELSRLMLGASTDELKDLIGHTTAAGPLDSERTLASIRATVGGRFSVWRELADHGDFSVRDWVREGDGGDGWLFLSYRDDQKQMLRHLVGAWLDLALVEALSMGESDDRQLWFLMDEVDSLGQVSNLDTALAKLRKYGGRCVLGCQSVSQLRKTYGRDGAQTLAANIGTKLVLRPGDHETAEYCSRELGDQEIARVTRSISGPAAMVEKRGGRMMAAVANAAAQGSGVSESRSVQHQRQAAVMPADLMNLAPLEGYLSLSGLPEIVHIEIGYRKVEPKQSAFVSKSEGAAGNGSLAAGQAAGAGVPVDADGGGSDRV